MTLVSAQGATNKALSKFHILAKNQAAAVFPRQTRGLVTRIMRERQLSLGNWCLCAVDDEQWKIELHDMSLNKDALLGCH